MKSILSVAVVLCISVGSMQVAVANISEKTGIMKSVTNVDKALSHVEVNPFVDRKRMENIQEHKSESSKPKEKKSFIRHSKVVKL